MPLVEINISRSANNVVGPLIEKLPLVIAQALSGDEPGSKLSADEIEVRVRQQSFFDLTIDGDIPPYDIAIIVFANDFPSRKANLDDRRSQIAAEIKPLLTGFLKGYVWVLLCPGSFGEI